MIVGLESKKITRAGDLVTALDDFSIGDKVSLTIQRGVGQQQVRHTQIEGLDIERGSGLAVIPVQWICGCDCSFALLRCGCLHEFISLSACVHMTTQLDFYLSRLLMSPRLLQGPEELQIPIVLEEATS